MFDISLNSTERPSFTNNSLLSMDLCTRFLATSSLRPNDNTRLFRPK